LSGMKDKRQRQETSSGNFFMCKNAHWHFYWEHDAVEDDLHRNIARSVIDTKRRIATSKH